MWKERKVLNCLVLLYIIASRTISSRIKRILDAAELWLCRNIQRYHEWNIWTMIKFQRGLEQKWKLLLRIRKKTDRISGAHNKELWLWEFDTYGTNWRQKWEGVRKNYWPNDLVQMDDRREARRDNKRENILIRTQNILIRTQKYVKNYD